MVSARVPRASAVKGRACAGSSALALWIVAQIIPGIQVRDFGAALVASIVIALVNFFVGPVLHFLALPFTILTLGLFLLVVNGFDYVEHPYERGRSVLERGLLSLFPFLGGTQILKVRKTARAPAEII